MRLLASARNVLHGLHVRPGHGPTLAAVGHPGNRFHAWGRAKSMRKQSKSAPRGGKAPQQDVIPGIQVQYFGAAMHRQLLQVRLAIDEPERGEADRSAIGGAGKEHAPLPRRLGPLRDLVGEKGSMGRLDDDEAGLCIERAGVVIDSCGKGSFRRQRRPQREGWRSS